MELAGFAIEGTTDCSGASVDGVEMDGGDGDDDAEEVEAVMFVGAPDTVGGVGVLVLTPDVSDAGETTRRDLRPPFC